LHRRRRAPARVALRIDALHLHGFSIEEQDALVASLESELGRLIAERGPPCGALRLDRLRIECARARDPRDAGRDAARVLYAGLRLSGQGAAKP
jgi:uncharacterized small protein (DUF1192 family)